MNTPFNFATVSMPAAAATAASTTPAPAPTPVHYTLPPLIGALPAEFQPSPVIQHEPEYELRWSDLYEDDIHRFRMEERGRCYAANYPYDILLEVYRKVYWSYPEDIRQGDLLVPEDHHSGVFQRDILEAMERIYIITTMPDNPPVLQRHNATLGTSHNGQ